MQAYFMPTLKENAVVMAVQMATKALQEAFDNVRIPCPISVFLFMGAIM